MAGLKVDFHISSEDLNVHAKLSPFSVDFFDRFDMYKVVDYSINLLKIFLVSIRQKSDKEITTHKRAFFPPLSKSVRLLGTHPSMQRDIICPMDL